MLFPVIKIKDNYGEHIVGTNSHDCLYIENNAIHYLTSQSMVGTMYPEESGMYFVGEEKEYSISGNPEIEFVTLEELIEIATKNLEKDTEATIRLNNWTKAYFEKKKECAEKLEQSKKETGVISNSCGMLF